MTVAQRGTLRVGGRSAARRLAFDRPNSGLMAERRHPSALVGLPGRGYLITWPPLRLRKGTLMANLMKRVEEFAKMRTSAAEVSITG